MDQIDPMTAEDMDRVLGWAADEGWNPGVADAAAFLAADPEGFLLKRVDGEPVAAVSVVNHDPGFAFLGLYICRPDWRGMGHGMDVWRAGLDHAGGRTIGLDGVPDQQSNYEASGFQRHGRTLRYAGTLGVEGCGSTRLATEADVEAILVGDRAREGYDRSRFLRSWLAQGAHRWTRAIDTDDGLAYATARICGEGLKIGPLVARDAVTARTLLADLTGDSPFFIDVPEDSHELQKLLEGEGFAPVFETARMYRGTPPACDPAPFSAVATLELG